MSVITIPTELLSHGNTHWQPLVNSTWNGNTNHATPSICTTVYEYNLHLLSGRQDVNDIFKQSDVWVEFLFGFYCYKFIEQSWLCIRKSVCSLNLTIFAPTRFFYKSSVTCQCHLVIWNMCYPEMPVKYGVYHNVQTIDGTSTTYAH